MTYTATINVTTGIFKKTIEELNGHEEMTIQLPNTVANRALIAADQSADLVWSVGPVTLFEGTCTGAIHSRGMLDCIVYNEAYEILQRHQPFNTSYTATLASVILTALGAHVGIAVSWDPVPDPNVSIRFDYANPMDVLIALAEVTGYDYWTTTGPLTIHVGVRGVARGAIVTLENSRRTLDRSKQRNNVRIRGVDAAGNIIYGTANAGGATRYVTFTEKKPSDQATLDALAEKKLIDVNKDTGPSPVSVSIAVGNVLFPGDTVTLAEAHLQLVGDYRLWKVERFMDHVMIYPDAPDMTTDEAIWDTRKYEDLGIYVSGAGTLPTGQQSFVTDIEFFVGDTLHNNTNTKFHWHNGAGAVSTIKYADGTWHTITSGESAALAQLSTFVYYVDVIESPLAGALTLTQGTVYGSIDEPNLIPLVTVVTPLAVATTMSVEIMPMFTAMAFSNPVVGGTFLSKDVIITPDFRTAWNVGEAGGPAGIRITPTEIAGYSAGVTKEFYLESTTGKAYFGGGAVIADATGLHVDGDGLVNIYDGTDTETLVGVLGGQVDLVGIAGAVDVGVVIVSQGTGDATLQSFGTGLTAVVSAVEVWIAAPILDLDADVDFADYTIFVDDAGTAATPFLQTDSGKLKWWMLNATRDVYLVAYDSGAGNPLGPNLKLIGDVATSVPAILFGNDLSSGTIVDLGSMLGDDSNINTYAFPETYNLAYLTYDFTTDGVGARLWLGPSAGTIKPYDDDMTGWANVLNCVLTNQTTIKHDGTHAIRIVVAGGAGSFQYDYGAGGTDWSLIIGSAFWWYGATVDTFKIVLEDTLGATMTKTFVDIVSAWGGREMFFTGFTEVGAFDWTKVRYIRFEDLTVGNTYYLDRLWVGQGSVTQFWNTKWWKLYPDEGVTETFGIDVASGRIYAKGPMIVAPTVPGNLLDYQLEDEWTGGIVVVGDFAGATVLDRSTIGTLFNFQTNVDATGQNVDGHTVYLPAVTNTELGTYTYKGLNIIAGALQQQTNPGTLIFRGIDINLADVTQMDGIVEMTGIDIQMANSTVVGGYSYGIKILGNPITNFAGHAGIYLDMDAAGDVAINVALGKILMGINNPIWFRSGDTRIVSDAINRLDIYGTNIDLNGIVTFGGSAHFANTSLNDMGSSDYTPDHVNATAAGQPASLTTTVTTIDTDGTLGLDRVTLANGSDGQLKIFYIRGIGNAADSLEIVPANMIGGTQITFGANCLGKGCEMVYNSVVPGWAVTGNNGGVIA